MSSMRARWETCLRWKHSFRNRICWWKNSQSVGSQTVSLCKSMITQLLTFPDVAALQVLHVHVPPPSGINNLQPLRAFMRFIALQGISHYVLNPRPSLGPHPGSWLNSHILKDTMELLHFYLEKLEELLILIYCPDRISACQLICILQQAGSLQQ